MSRVDELIAQFCPQGVRHIKLADIATVKTGQGISKKEIDTNPGEFPVINSGREPLGFYEKFNTENDPIGITSRGAGVGSVTWCEGRYFRGNLNYAVTVNEPSMVNVRFLYHLLLQMQSDIQALCTFQGIPALNKINLERLRIPVPPLVVQRAIVEILDNFTALEAELEAELEARKKQYEYYRLMLLSNENFEVRTLSDLILSISSGRNKSRIEGGQFPVYGSTGQIGSTDRAAYFSDAILIARVGANAGRVNMASGEYDVSDNTLIVQPGPELDIRFAFHLLTSMNLNQYAVGGGQPLITGKKLKALRIAVPSIEEQHRIAAILDKFDALVNDLSSGLPAEIAARRKQYEYYRDQLLTFKELAA